MTDEEKAIKDLCVKCSSYDFCKKGNQLHCAETVAYIKGLAEGRKEKEELIGMFINVDLEKENAKLKEQIEQMKCCGNCKHYDYCPMSSNIECNNANNNLKYKWELAE